MNARQAPVRRYASRLRDAQAALERAALRAEHNQDETGAWLRAQAVAIGALRQALANFTASNAALVEKAKQPIDNDTLRFAVIKGIEAHATASVRAINARNTILAVSALLVVAAIAFAGGWLTAQNQLVTVPELSAAIRAKDASTWVKIIDQNPRIADCNRLRISNPSGEACGVWVKPPGVN